MFSLKLFSKCCGNEWLQMFKANKETFYFEAGQRIFTEGEIVKGIFFVEKGNIKVLSKAYDKTDKIIRLASTGMILGHRGFNAKRYPVSAEALTQTIVTFVPLNVFLNILKASPEMVIYLLNFMSDELQEAELRMKNLIILDPKVRIAIILLKLVEVFGYQKKEVKNLLSFTISRTDMANMGGTTYETVIRTLAIFKKNKVISLAGKEIVILNEKKLRQIATGKMKD